MIVLKFVDYDFIYLMALFLSKVVGHNIYSLILGLKTRERWR